MTKVENDWDRIELLSQLSRAEKRGQGARLTPDDVVVVHAALAASPPKADPQSGDNDRLLSIMRKSSTIPVKSGVVARVRSYVDDFPCAAADELVDRDRMGEDLTFGDLRALLALASSKEERVSEPTEAMMRAGVDAYEEGGIAPAENHVRSIYLAMCAAQVGG